MKYFELAKEIHENAVDKGFWEKERNVGEMLMLAISELSEALEQHRDGMDNIYFEDSKPEGTAIEVADCAIRLMDTVYGRMAIPENLDWLVDHSSREVKELPENFGDALRKISGVIATADEIGGGVMKVRLCRALFLCVQLIERLGSDPEKTIRIKMDYNITREYKHGKAY